MDSTCFDWLTRTLAEGATRRWLVRSLAGVPIVGLLGVLMEREREEAAADGRRRRRKKRHKHGKGRHKEQRKGKRKGHGQGRRKERPAPCQPEPLAITCTDACGNVDNNCGEEVDCGPCGCPAGETACGDQCFVPGSDCVYCESSGNGGVCLPGSRVCADNHVVCEPNPSFEQDPCDGLDNDGDGLTDEGSPCPDVPNAASACVNGACVLTCVEGFGNCDGGLENGCETDLQTDARNCGRCGNSCRCSDGTIKECRSGICSGCPVDPPDLPGSGVLG